MTSSLVLVGVGPHAEHGYLPMIRDLARTGQVRLLAAVDLRDRRDQVTAVLARVGVAAEHLLLLEPGGAGLDPLDRLARDHRIDGLVVATDPRAHARYLEWAAQHDVRALVDKPVTAHPMDFTDEAAETLVRDFEFLGKKFADSAATATVMVPRRTHPGIELLHDTLRDAVAELGLPITYLDLYHSSGYWNMPDEFLSRENHPYRYGYGALLHSGYHFVDLAARLLQLNAMSSVQPWADSLDVSTRHTTPADVLAQVPEDFYRRFGLGAGLAGAFSADGRRAAAGCGETDVQLSFAALRGADTVAWGSMTMLETGLSHRAWRALPADTYKGNGKFSQDRFAAHLGHVLGVHARDERPEGSTGPPRFCVEVSRSRLIGGPPLVRHVIDPATAPGGGPGVSLSVLGKRALFRRWLDGPDPELDLTTHELTVRLLAAAYTAMFRQRRGLPATATVELRHPARGADRCR